MSQTVPASLRKWFVLHFAADMLFGVPLFIAPAWFLGLVGWQEVDPVTARLVAAALFGIGIQSLVGRHGDASDFRGMLNLKIIWSSTATAGIVWSLLEGAPRFAWAFAALFAAFCGVWTYFRLRLRAE